VTRAILAADGTAADPLKIFLPNVSWVQPPTRTVVIGEIDIVGAQKRQRLVSDGPASDAEAHGTPLRRYVGWPLPRSRPPAGSVLLARIRFDNWVVARFALKRPLRLQIAQLVALAPRYFGHAPVVLLAFVQRPGSGRPRALHPLQ